MYSGVGSREMRQRDGKRTFRSNWTQVRSLTCCSCRNLVCIYPTVIVLRMGETRNIKYARENDERKVEKDERICDQTYNACTVKLFSFHSIEITLFFSTCYIYLN